MNCETTQSIPSNKITQNENKKFMRAIVKTYPKITGKTELNLVCFMYFLKE
jgi:hypothetical protein